ncbi:hypothetical protein GGH12_003237 [Coemansia sp. RSA 1822]|nr:hypothetical protein LPJ76_005261 [Coemansia sp. RSA 638]KAJ2119748.1 hypothetical protein IW147_005631 [Coemansia sp. RSA 720]KAJ2545124.1 hypothetical protein GGF49_000733 [Coemansia sp. RSA 1853]KAJ2562386.1 hypothetical protein GGH12_003237 [Coemansia sp. RSA 1822]
MAGAQLLETAAVFLQQHWIRILSSLVVFLGTYSWMRREFKAPCPPSTIFVPSTSTYPSTLYTARRKISVQQFIDDFLAGRIELRDAQSGQGMLRIPDVVSFRFDLGLAWRVLYTFLTTSHSKQRDRRNIEQYVLNNSSLFEETLGPDRLPLVGYIREGMPEQLENSLSIQMERVGREYLDLGSDDRLLDINAQWGDLAVYLAHDYQVPTCAIIATPSQLAHATNLTGESQVQRFMRFITGDYRAIPQCLAPGIPPFTKVMALDVLDTIGPRNIPAFLRSVNETMVNGGRLLLQVTTTPSSIGYRSRQHTWNTPMDGQNNHQSNFSGHSGAASVSGLGPDHADLDEDGGNIEIRGEEEWAEHWWYHWFRQRYIQPGADTSMLVSVEQVMVELQRAGFEVLQLESLTTDAAMTTAIWSNRLCASKRQIETELGEAAYRAWELYLNWTQSLYARARLHKHFILAVKRA